MPAATPTILATSGGFLPAKRTPLRPGPLLELAIELAGSPPLPRLCFLGTALGDQAQWSAAIHAAWYGREVLVSCLALFPMPNVEDMAEHLGMQDVIWVNGGSTANLLALWRLHGLDVLLRRCWESGVVLGGVSAGSLCWHVGGTTDSFGPVAAPPDRRSRLPPLVQRGPLRRRGAAPPALPPAGRRRHSARRLCDRQWHRAGLPRDGDGRGGRRGCREGRVLREAAHRRHRQ